MRLSKNRVLFRSVAAWAIVLASGINVAFADHPPISNNPDDYDVAKYQRIHDEALRRLRDSERLLSQLENRVQNVSAQLDRSEREFEETRRDIEAHRSRLERAQARINELQDLIQRNEAEITRLQRELPTLDRALQQEQRRLEQLKTQLQAARQEARQLEQEAQTKEQQAAALEESKKQKLQAFNQIKREFDEAQAEVTTAHGEKAVIEQEIRQLEQERAQLVQQIESIRGGLAQMEREAAQKQAEANDKNAKADDFERKSEEALRKGNRQQAAQMRAQAQRFRREAREAQQAADDLNTRVTNGQRQLAQKESRLTDVTRKIQVEQAKLPAAEQKIARAEQKKRQLEPRFNAARAEFQQAKELAENAARLATQARARANQAQAQVEALRRDKQASEARVAELERRPREIRERIAALQNEINSATAELPRHRQAVADSTRAIRELTPEFRRRGNRVEALRRELAEAVQQRDQAIRVVENDRRYAAETGRRLAEVQENLRRGMIVAQDEGRMDGSMDGTAEGSRVGSERGQREGTENGIREGRENGRREGIARERAAGAAEGESQGSAKGSEEGDAEGRSLGESEGRERGRAAGLAAGYETGRAEGDAEGHRKGVEAGHKLGGFEKGKREGLANGRARGESEGSVAGRTDGYNKGRTEFFEADLSETTIPNQAASGVFARDGWDNYNPRRRYPHPDLDRAYEAAYERAFLDSASESFDRVYRDAYSRARNIAYEREYTDYANREYPEERRAAYSQAYEAARAREFERAKQAAYEQVYQPTYDREYQAALPVRREEGRRDGHRAGFERGKSEAYESDFARGRAEGETEGYTQAYQPAYDRAHAQGHAEAVAYFSSNDVLRYDGALVADANDDGVFAPGEPVSLTVAMKNFGKVSQDKDVEVVVVSASEGIAVEKARDVLVAIPGQSRAVVTGVASLRVASNAEIGKTETVELRIVQDEEVLGTARLSLTPSFPYSVDSSVAGYVEPGVESKVSVQVSNVSSKKSSGDVTVRLVSADGLAEVRKSEESLGQIDAGTRRNTELTFTIAEENAFKTLSFEVQVVESTAEGEWLLGIRRFSVEATKRWSFRPESTGLLVIASRDVGKQVEAAVKTTDLTFDTWDIRVEGQLSQEAADKYADKMIVIPSVTGELDQATAAVIEGYLSRGGAVYAGMRAGAERTAVGASVFRQVSAFEAKKFYQMNFYQGNFFRPADGRKMVLHAEDARDLKLNGISGRIQVFHALTRSIQDKVTLYLSAMQAGTNTWKFNLARHAIMHDLVKEMWDDKAVGGSNYKNNKANLRLTAFINIALSKAAGSDERRALLRFHPELDAERKKIGWWLSARRIRIGRVLKPLKQAYKKEIDD